VAETDIKIKGEWYYLYRAVDSTGQTIDFMLSAKRDARAAKRFFRIHDDWREEKGIGVRVVADIPQSPIAPICAGAIPSPFFSLEVTRRADGVERVDEIGDGQVSDLVGWSVERFVDIWRDAD